MTAYRLDWLRLNLRNVAIEPDMIYEMLDKFKEAQGEIASGSVLSYDGRNITTDAFRVTVGAQCSVMLGSGAKVFGEVIRVSKKRNVISLYESFQNIHVGDRVSVRPGGSEVAVGNCLLGRVIDGQGKIIDAGAEFETSEFWPLHGVYINPVMRSKISDPLDVGVRSINAAMTVGKGQRIGIISGSGVGKSSLITMMTEYTDADIVVIGLIGERGREVAEFVSKAVQLNNFHNTIIIAEPANSSPLLRIKGAQRATAVAEYFRAQGKDVLLIIDSLTRVAHAQREIGLSRGEATIAKGYTSSVLDLIPNLIERAGTGTNGVGSITAIYTVLADGDDVVADPIVDAARAILDGHITLSREQAAQGIFPAIDITMSISRVMNEVVDLEISRRANQLRALVSTYNENRDLVLMGGYVAGQNKQLDLALKIWPKIVDFLAQPITTRASLLDSQKALLELVK